MSDFLSPVEQIKYEAAERKKAELKRREPVLATLQDSLARKDDILKDIAETLHKIDLGIGILTAAIKSANGCPDDPPAESANPAPAEDPKKELLPDKGSKGKKSK